MSRFRQKKLEGSGSLMLGTSVIAALTPIVLLGAHYARGGDGDAPYVSYIYAIILIAIGTVSLLGSKFRAATPGIAFAAALFAGWVASGLAGNWYRAEAEVISLAAAGAVFVTGRAAGLHPRSLTTVWHVLVWSLLVLAVFALFNHSGSYAGDPLQVSTFETVRLNAGFVSPNTAATLLALAALVAMGQLLYTVSHTGGRVQTRNDLIDHIFRNALPAIFLFVIASSCLWLTGSRAGIASFAVAVLVLTGWEYRAYRRGRRRTRKRYKRMRWLIFGIVSIIAGIAVFGEMFSNRAIEATTDAQSRLDFYQIYWQVWQERPWFGHGLGSFNRVNDSLMTQDNVAMIGLMGSAHNVVLQWLIQQGIIGTALMATLILSLHVPIVRALRAKNPYSRTFLRLALCASALVFLHSMLDYALEIPSIMWTYSFLLGLAHGRGTMMLSVQNDAVEENEQTVSEADLVVA